MSWIPVMLKESGVFGKGLKKRWFAFVDPTMIYGVLFWYQRSLGFQDGSQAEDGSVESISISPSLTAH